MPGLTGGGPQDLFAMAQFLLPILNDPAKLEDFTRQLSLKGDVDPAAFQASFAEGTAGGGLGLTTPGGPQVAPLPGVGNPLVQSPGPLTIPPGATPPIIPQAGGPAEEGIGALLAKIGQGIEVPPAPTSTAPPAPQAAAPPAIGEINAGGGIDIQQLIASVLGGQAGGVSPVAGFGQALLGQQRL